MHPLGQQAVNVVDLTPLLILCQSHTCCNFLETPNLEFVPLRKMSLGADVGEKVRDVREFGLLGAETAGEQRLVHVVLAGCSIRSAQGKKHL